MTRGAGFVAAVAATLTMAGGAADQTTADSTGVAESISGYVLTWADEFNGSGQADTSNWGYETGMPRNNELQYYRSGADNAAQRDGRLVITLKKEQYGKGKNTAEYTSASLITKGKRSFQYGKYVFRARIPTKKGYWPVMWLMGSNIDSVDWAGCGEIDVQECYWKDNVPNLLCNFCWAGNGNQSDYPTSWNIKNYNVNSLDAGGADAWSSKYHTWAMDWDENSIKIYLDGTPENGYTDGFLLNSQDLSATINGTGGKGGSAGQNPFRLPQYILLNFPFGGDAGGQCGIDDSGLPAQMEVDYIRVYRKVGTQDGLVGANVPDPEPDSAYAPTKYGPAVYDGYELSWSDEFNGTGAPDASNWDYELGYVRNNEAQNYTRDNAVMKDGALVITGKKEQDGTYTSSSIVTKGQRHFLYGRYEFRARIPTSGGAWPVMWMMGTNYTWPNGGEIDILEYYCGTVLCNWCWGGNDPNNMYSQSWNAKRTPLTDFTNVDPDWVNKFHVWRMDWTEERCDVYVDGVWINGQDLSQTLNPNDYGEGTAGISPFRKPQYILLDIAMGGNSGGTIDDAALPMVMEVDYVRCYKRTGTNEGMFVPAPIDITPGTGADYEPDGSAPAKVDGYRLCWNDEFNEGNYPAAANWNVTEGSTVAVGNGVLAMTAQKQGDGSLTWGEVNTKNLHSFTNGIIDIRARIPVTKGLFTSMFTKTVEENENFYAYMEFLDARWISGAPLVAGWWQWNPDGDNGQWYDRQIANLVEKDPKWAAKFHVWRYKVDSENVSISIDGAQIFTYPLAWMYHNGLCTVGSDRFPHYLTMALYSNTDDATLDETRIPASLEVDYVRCYEPGEETVDPGDDPGPGDDPAPAVSGPVPTASSWTSFESAQGNVFSGVVPVLEETGDAGENEQYIKDANKVISKLTDGFANTADTSCFYAIRNGAKVTWSLSAPSDIREFRIYSGWGDEGRSGVAVESIEVKYSADGAWVKLPNSTFNWCKTYTDENTVTNAAPAGNLRLISFADPSGADLAKGVEQVRITFGIQDNAWDGYAEIEAIGALAAVPCYRYYRFKVEGTRSPDALMMQIADVILRRGSLDITSARSELLYDTETKPVNGLGGTDGTDVTPSGEQHANAADSNATTKWLDFRCSTNQTDAVRDAVWIAFDYGEPTVVTSYEWHTANDADIRDPSAWRFQGSSDGEKWIDLDVVSGFGATLVRTSLAYSKAFGAQLFSLKSSTDDSTEYTTVADLVINEFPDCDGYTRYQIVHGSGSPSDDAWKTYEPGTVPSDHVTFEFDVGDGGTESFVAYIAADGLPTLSYTCTIVRRIPRENGEVAIGEALPSGYLTDFLHLGANFTTDDLAAAGFDTDLLASHGGEANQRPYEGLAYTNLVPSADCTSGTTLVWTPVHRDSGIFDPGERNYYTKYFHTYLHVPGAVSRSAYVYLRQDDDVRIWNNGELAVESLGWDNNAEKGPFAITLYPGENSLTFRLREGDGGDYMAVRFADGSGNAFTDITYTPFSSSMFLVKDASTGSGATATSGSVKATNLPQVDGFTKFQIVQCGADGSASAGAEWQAYTKGETPSVAIAYANPAKPGDAVSFRLFLSNADGTAETNFTASIVAQFTPSEDPDEPEPVDPAYVPSTGEPTVYAGYSMAWNDEFNEEGAPNSADWRVEEGSTLACTGGALVLTAGSTEVANGENWAALDTRGKRQFKMGRYEIRAKLPFSNGVHASVWFNGDAEPKSESEYQCYNFIDAEYSWVDAGYWANSIAQWWEWDSTEKDGWSAKDVGSVAGEDSDWANKYHVYRLDWDETTMKVYVDDTLQWTYDITTWKTGDNASPFADPDNLYKIMIGLDRRDVNNGSYASLPQTFAIDYIRYYTPVPVGDWPVVDGAQTATPADFLAAAKDGAVVVLPASFAWDGNVLKKDGEPWATLPAIYSVQNGAVSLDAAQVRPVIGADAQATVDGIAVVDGAVKINVTNAKAGLYYGYRFATALGSLDTAPVTWRGESAAQDGDLLIPAGDAGTAGFYRVIVGDRAPQN